MSSLAQEVGAAAAEALGPIAENAVSRVINSITANKDDLLERLSGKTIEITLPSEPIRIKLPDLKKK